MGVLRLRRLLMPSSLIRGTSIILGDGCNRILEVELHMQIRDGEDGRGGIVVVRFLGEGVHLCK